MSGYIGGFGLVAIFGAIAVLGCWSRGKRKEVGEFYKSHSLFLASDVPPLVRQTIGVGNVLCLKGGLTIASGEDVPFLWWEWSSTSTVQAGTGPQAIVSSFLAISFPPDIVSATFERQATQAAQSHHTWPQKVKEAFVLNTHDPIRTEKLQDGSFMIFWQILQRREVMEEKLAWLKANLSVKSLDAHSLNLTQPTFYKHDTYAMMRQKFSAAWPNLELTLHHAGVKFSKEGWDEVELNATFADLNTPHEALFTLTDETPAARAAKLFAEHYDVAIYILRDGASVEEGEPLNYCNNPFRLPLNELTYGEFKRRFTAHWTNLSIELCDTSPHKGGLSRTGKELADDFDMSNLKYVGAPYLHDHLYLSDWGRNLGSGQVAASIKHNRLGVYAEGNLSVKKLKDFQALEQ